MISASVRSDAAGQQAVARGEVVEVAGGIGKGHGKSGGRGWAKAQVSSAQLEFLQDGGGDFFDRLGG